MRHKKIPGKKTKGFKDPEAQRERRENSKSHELRPDNVEDDQKIPRKLKQIVKFKENPEKFEFSRQRKKQREKPVFHNGVKMLDSSRYLHETDKPVPVFKQSPGESRKSFFNRMEKVTKAVIERKKYEKKFDVDVIDDLSTGTTIVQDRVKDEVKDFFLFFKMAAIFFF